MIDGKTSTLRGVSSENDDYYQVAPEWSRTNAFYSIPACRRAAMLLPAEADNVCAARRFASAFLTLWGVANDDQASPVLIISELATNAVLHGRSEMAIELCVAEHVVRIEVTDFGEPAAAPSPGCFEEAAGEHGRGLSIVECLSDWIEIHREAWGRRVSVGVGISNYSMAAAA